MFRPIPIQTRTLIILVAVCAVVFSVMSREARQLRGCAGPGDFVAVEVLEALPCRPIEGKHRVAADGTIDLGPPYGRIDVDGLTYLQIKVRVVGRLQRFLNDSTLGLTWTEQVNGLGPIVPHHVEPAETDRIFVDFELPDVEDYSTHSSILEAINSYLGFEPEPRYECGTARLSRRHAERNLAYFIEKVERYAGQIFIGPQLLIWSFLLWRFLVATCAGFRRNSQARNRRDPELV